MKPKSPLDGLKEALDRMTPEEKEKWRNDAMERVKKAREEREKKEREPPERPTGTCVACGGLVKADFVHGLRSGVDSRFVPIGPGSRQYYGWNFRGYNCTQCGLSYKFPPPEGIVTGKGDVDERGEPSQVDQGGDRAGARRGRRGSKKAPADV